MFILALVLLQIIKAQMDFERQAYKHLSNWKESSNRKPLILRGARQVGKTTLVKAFSKNYKHIIQLNLERKSDLKYFSDYDDVPTIIDALFVSYNMPSNQKKNTLLFIDEIQESPEAIALLRYFYEDAPELHVIAAGSLLEHVMRKVKNFPVGRIQYLYIFPLNFIEYLKAKGQNEVLKQINTTPLPSYAHNALLKLFNEYAIIGGMPEIVNTYLTTNSVADLHVIYESIWGTYKEDVEKYATNSTNAKVIKHIISTAHLYLDKRIKFENFGKSNYKSREVGEAMRNLDDARIIQLIYPTTEVTAPIQPNINKSPRLQFLDTGLVNYELSIQAEMLALDDLNNSYKGAIIPHLITQELLSLNTLNYKKPTFWVREKTQSSAEVDLVVQHKNMIIPIEIKSGKEGKLKSLHQFIEQTNHCYAVRMYAGEFSIEQHYTPNKKKPYFLMNLPYFLGTKIHDYLEYFIMNNSL